MSLQLNSQFPTLMPFVEPPLIIVHGPKDVVFSLDHQPLDFSSDVKLKGEKSKEIHRFNFNVVQESSAPKSQQCFQDYCEVPYSYWTAVSLTEMVVYGEEENEMVGYDKLGAGQNATVAVMSYSGYDIEDAIAMSKASLDRGFGRCIVMKRLSVIIQKYENNTQDRIARPNRAGNDAGRMQVLDDDGIAAPGKLLDQMTYILTNKLPELRGGLCDFKFAPQTFKGPIGESSVVDKVALFTDKNNNMCTKYLIRHTRRPEAGDKFSSRHGQKGVCGTIVQQEDFPFSERGICPDLIMNPHGFPSGMTVGKMIELLGGKAGVSCGRFHYGSAFGEPSDHADTVEAISQTPVEKGFSYNGKDFIYSGFSILLPAVITYKVKDNAEIYNILNMSKQHCVLFSPPGIKGCPLQAYILMGPIYYQKLKHMVRFPSFCNSSSMLMYEGSYH
ncbi:hypothetical protein FEM48_ZijujUnG0002600 [Ziziphus jujuba var. spinosa]|uniref:DNA-directed RNA polymerase n=1 Tax=Ziziphus jujuba var. spinosa TaxID=714518 RepID=A0A978UA45_ZIZJJ|nr:hypothetical protein FEM48_ZijujUnG0002600 [Ziziphus jujuba var. spinosa]